jgi:hypothetical protein
LDALKTGDIEMFVPLVEVDRDRCLRELGIEEAEGEDMVGGKVGGGEARRREARGERREARGERREARGERREARGERREARGERREAGKCGGETGWKEEGGRTMAFSSSM